MRFLGLVCGLLLAACSGNQSIPSLTSSTGNWSDPATWGGKVPTSGTNLEIPAGQVVTLDTNAVVGGLTVYGTLNFARKDLQLEARWIMVEGKDAALKIGNSLESFKNRASITLTGSNETENIMGMGTKFLAAMNGGRLEIYGEQRMAWTKLNRSVAKGATQLELAETPDWRVGESIVLASSALDPTQAETRVITAVNNKTISFDQPLEFAHYGQLQSFAGKTLDERAEVGLLSRNIVIEGDAASQTKQFGGHVMVMGVTGSTRETNIAASSTAKIQGIEFRRLGQFQKLGRYPLHWHRNGNSSSSFVAGSSFHQNYQRGVVVHASDQIRISENVVYGSVGHSYMTEDRSEIGNTFERNLGILTKPFPKPSSNAEQAAQNDEQAATFWIRGPNNKFIANHAAGGWHSGFWFDGALATNNDFVFRDNTAHSYLVGRGIKGSCCFGEKGALWITPEKDTYGTFHGPFEFTNTTLYKNREAFWALPKSGDGTGASSVDLNNAILADNALGLSSQGLRDSIIIGRSANTDADPEVGRAGVQEYGNTSRLENITFVNFTDGGTALETRNCFREAPNVISKGIQLINAELNLCSGSSDLSILDDGTLSGTGQISTITPASNESGSRAMWTADCPLSANKTTRACPGKLEYWHLYVQTAGGTTPSLIRDDGVQLDASDVESYPFYWTMIQGRIYALSQDLSVTSAIRLRAGIKYNNEADENMIRTGRVTVPVAGNYSITQCDYGAYDGMTCKNKTTLPSVANAAALEGRQTPAYYYDISNKKLHIWLVAGTDTSVILERK